MTETMKGTSEDFLYKIGSILGLEFGTNTGNHPIVRNMYENYDLQAEFWNYEAKHGENGENQRKMQFLKNY